MLLSTYVILSLSTTVYADTSQGDNYIFHMQINTDPDQQNLPYNQPGKYIIKRPNTPIPTIPPKPPVVIRKVTPPPTSIEIGYTNNQPHSDLRLLLSDSVIDFGPLSPTDFITRDSAITILGDPSYMYSVLAYQNHPLQNEKNQIIPNTRCDDGNCTDNVATDWTDTLTFGFGYHCTNNKGTDCEKSFGDKDSYKTFSMNDTNQNGSTVMSGQISSTKKNNILYKINVPGTQQQGLYQNSITYLAVPLY